MPWILRGLSNGIVTTKYPKKSDSYGNNWHGSIKITHDSIQGTRDQITDVCPTNAISLKMSQLSIDRGLCILCGQCVDSFENIFAFTPDFETATIAREHLIVPNIDDDIDALEELKANLMERTKNLGNSIAIRHIDFGSDGSEEWEISALTNPIYDIQRLGITFTASPRHADILLVTGAGSMGMVNSVKETYLQMPNPKIVIAVGTDAISGGLHRSSTATTGNGVAEIIPVDIYVPGSPPSPFGILYGILLATELISERGESK